MSHWENLKFIHHSVRIFRANLPFQVMEFPDHKYPENATSYPPHRDVLAFIHSYADRFDLKRHIKLSHLTISVKPTEMEKWEVIVKDLVTGMFETCVYDAILICNGHYFKPRIPQLDGVDSFVGEMLHSHNYRTAKAYSGKHKSDVLNEQCDSGSPFTKAKIVQTLQLKSYLDNSKSDP